MKTFNVKIEGFGDRKYNFTCEENTYPIEIDDKFLFFFGGVACIGICGSENEKYEINKNNHKSDCSIDLVSGFWERCYKIKFTDFDLKQIE